MPRWLFEKKELRETPSMSVGIDPDTEARYRREGTQFILDVARSMNLGFYTMATGVVYFHRFFMIHSFKEFHRYPMACACLFLAGKVEETPKKCKDILKTARELLPAQKFALFGENTLDALEEIMTLERILLQTIKFDIQVEHPYTFILKYAKCLKGDKARLQKMVQMAWIFVNDSLSTTLCLQWEPEIIAIALMYLAGKLSKFEVVDWYGRTSEHLRWWDVFVENITIELLEDICHQVLDIYSHNQHNNTPDSPNHNSPHHPLMNPNVPLLGHLGSQNSPAVQSPLAAGIVAKPTRLMTPSLGAVNNQSNGNVSTLQQPQFPGFQTSPAVSYINATQTQIKGSISSQTQALPSAPSITNFPNASNSNATTPILVPPMPSTSFSPQPPLPPPPVPIPNAAPPLPPSSENIPPPPPDVSAVASDD